MIESGSHTPGVSVRSFGLPANTGLRYEQPDPALTGYLTDYHVLDSVEEAHSAAVEWMLPSWAAIRIILSKQPITIRLGVQVYDPMPIASLYGTTSRALEVTTNGGVTIGVGVSPLGWSRLFRSPAATYRDRIVPLEEVMPVHVVADLVAQLRASDQGPAVKGLLDGFFALQFAEPNRDEPQIRQLMTLILDDETQDLAVASARLGIQPHTLRRLSTRYFGFPPKALLVRARFLRSLMKVLATGNPTDYSVIAATYHDLPHFLRDAHRFLGMTPRQFMAIPTPYLDAVLRARAVVLGAATGVLQPLAKQPPAP